MAEALVGPFIPAKGYTRGRKADTTVTLLVGHSAEGATDETNLGSYFAGTTSGSSNCGFGQDGGYALYVNYGDTPWSNPPLNTVSDTAELCGFARWTREEWLAHEPMLDAFAAWIAWRCAVRQIPVVLLGVADIAAGKSGVTDHRTINEVYHQSSHWDLGYHFPWDVVMPKAQGQAVVPVQTDPVPVAVEYASPLNAGYSIAYMKQIQTLLNAVAHAGLVVDGLRGPVTKGAIVAFQSAHGLKPDALPGPLTLAALQAAQATPPAAPSGKITRVLHRGDTGADVALLQRTLNAWYPGLPALVVDEDYGAKTEARVAYMQGKARIKVDGVAGPQTLGRLGLS